MDNLDALIYKLIHRGKLSIEELAELWGVSVNYVYKMALPEFSPSHSSISLRRALAAMQLQKDYSLLKYMCARAGGIFVKMPRVPKDKRDENQIVSDYQDAVSGAVRLLIKYFQEPTAKNRKKLIEKLDNVTAKSVGIRKRVQNDAQLKLFEEV